MRIVFYRIQELKKYYKIILQNYNITIILQNSLYIYIYFILINIKILNTEIKLIKLWKLLLYKLILLLDKHYKISKNNISKNISNIN